MIRHRLYIFNLLDHRLGVPAYEGAVLQRLPNNDRGTVALPGGIELVINFHYEHLLLITHIHTYMEVLKHYCSIK